MHEQAEPLLAKLRSTFLPNRVLTVAAEGADPSADGQGARVTVLEALPAILGPYTSGQRIAAIPGWGR